MIRKIIYINLFFVFLNLLFACCKCDEEPVGNIEINRAKIEEIVPQKASIKGIAFRLKMEDSTAKVYFSPNAVTLYPAANAMTRCDCISRKILKEKIESIKIFTVKNLSEDFPQKSDVTEFFVSDKLEQVFGTNVLKTSLSESIQYFNNLGYINDNYIPFFNLYLTLKEPVLPAQFWVEISLIGGKKFIVLSPEFK